MSKKNQLGKPKENICYITKAQIKSIIDAKDDIKAMLGVAEDDSHWIRYVRNMEKFLKNNSLENI